MKRRAKNYIINETKSCFFEKINKIDKLSQSNQKEEGKLIKLEMESFRISQEIPMKFRGL
jgi:hexokinase